MLAAVGNGWFASVDDAAGAWVTTTVVASPGQSATLYRDRHAAYRVLYPALAPTFHRA